MKKEYKEKTNVCNVTFTLSEEIVKKAKKVHLVSDFNQWDHAATPMKKTKNGYYSVSVKLPIGKEYQFRYLIDNSRWENDPEADHFVPSPYGNDENSVLIV